MMKWLVSTSLRLRVAVVVLTIVLMAWDADHRDDAV